MRPEVLEVVRLWVRKAEHDLEAARRILAIDEGCPYDTVCFHCQQAVEKYLKALLTQAGTQAPRTHDVEELLAILPDAIRPSVAPLDMARLNSYAVNVRYADDSREPVRAEAARAFEVAQSIRIAARKFLSPESLH